MEATGLRIGNKVDLYGSIATVQRFDFNDRPPNGLAINKGKPILLTESWLLKFGFEKKSDNVFILNAASFTFEWICNDGMYLESMGVEINYVHQLQNLFFLLTGSELTE